MKTYTGWEYLCIDATNHYGLDKLLFEDKIAFITDNISQLEVLGDKAEVKPLYMKAVMAIRKAQKGLPMGHLVGLDACCSGIQVMSALTGCVSGAHSTGLIDPNMRADAYGKAKDEMEKILGSNVDITRTQAKYAIMTSFYGSKAMPKSIFGEDTPELAAFYQAAHTIAPGAWELLQDLLASWQPYALEHAWQLPDGYNAKVKVMKQCKARVEVDELDHSTFTYEFYENEGSKKGLSNVANVTHSMDGWVLRSMHRRCNYDRANAEYVSMCINAELVNRQSFGNPKESDIKEFMTDKISYYIAQYTRSTLADAVIIPHLDQATVTCLSTEHLNAVNNIVNGMLAYQPFELVTVHDEFKCHANNMNHVRWQYKEILAEIADSDVLNDLLSQITGMPGTFQKVNFNLPEQIRESNYALC